MYQWHAGQEAHAGQAALAMDEAALQRFLAHTERLSRHALVTLPEQADSLRSSMPPAASLPPGDRSTRIGRP